MKSKNGIPALALSALFTAVMAVCALITVPAPIPFTLQTLALFLIAGLLPLSASLFSVSAYLLLGAVGLPIFSGFSGGFGVLFGPTGGFLLGFLLFLVVQKLIYRLSNKKHMILSQLAGLLVCYFSGTLWYLVYSHEASFITVLCVSVLPFILPDLIKLFLTMLIIKRIGKLYDLG